MTDTDLSQMQSTVACGFGLSCADSQKLLDSLDVMAQERDDARGCKPDAWEHLKASERMHAERAANAERQRDEHIRDKHRILNEYQETVDDLCCKVRRSKEEVSKSMLDEMDRLRGEVLEFKANLKLASARRVDPIPYSPGD